MHECLTLYQMYNFGDGGTLSPGHNILIQFSANILVSKHTVDITYPSVHVQCSCFVRDEVGRVSFVMIIDDKYI